MPDLRGKTIKEALLMLNDLGIKWSVSGSGVVTEQSISPGNTINKKKTCFLTCSQISPTGARVY
jgi:beta-lactam-binding protein with PASTA domain